MKVEVAVVGLGAVGSAILAYLAQRGVSVLGLDRFDPPHDRGSSHGQTRVIREAYFEHPDYVPLLRRAYRNWEDLELRGGQTLLQKTGGLMLGPQDSTLLKGSQTSAETWNIPYRVLNADLLAQTYPAFQLPPHFGGIEEQRAGYLYPEKAIATCLRLAQAQGAELRTNEPLLSWKAQSDGFLLKTAQGDYQCEKLILSTGAWLSEWLAELNLPLQVTRQTLFWFETPQPNPFALGKFPIFLLEYQPDHYLYGFPDEGEGFKLAVHVPGQPIQPDRLAESQVTETEVADMLALAHPFFPALKPRLVKSAVCMYTNTPDGHFLIDTHPEFSKLWYVSPCSGHGFKFASALGETVADWVISGQPAAELNLFRNRPGRF